MEGGEDRNLTGTVVTEPRALANLTSSSRQIASIQHFPCEALWPPAQGFGGFQSTEKAQLPLGDNSPTRRGRGRATWQKRLKRKESYLSAETLESDVGRRKKVLRRSCNMVLIPVSGRGQLQDGNWAGRR